MISKNLHSDHFSEALSKKLSNLEILTTILAIISIFLLIVLLLFSRIITFNPTGPLLPSEQNPYAFATLYKLNNSHSNFNEKMGTISIFPDANSAMTLSAFVKGYVNDLIPGTSHGVLILENTNFLLVSDENDNQLFHFNPTGSLSHNCKKDSNIITDNEGHMGDLGDVIANDMGKANVDKYVSGFNVNLIYGRAIVVLKNEDPCNTESFYLQKSEILAFGILGIYSEDKEEIELKRQMIEKKKKNMFNFQEKTNLNLKKEKIKDFSDEMKFKSETLDSEKINKELTPMNLSEQEYFAEELQNKNLVENNDESKSILLQKSMKKTEKLNQTKKIEENSENLFTNFAKASEKLLTNSLTDSEKLNSEKSLTNSATTSENLLINSPTTSEKSLTNFMENLDIADQLGQKSSISENALQSLFNFQENNDDNFLKKETSHIKKERLRKSDQNPKLNLFKNSSFIFVQKKKTLTPAIEAEMKSRKKTLFIKQRSNSSSIFSDIHEPNKTFIKDEKKENHNNVTAIFEKLANLIDSTADKSNQIDNLKENGNVFLGIDLGQPLHQKKELRSKNIELKKFQRNFEDGVQENLHSKLKKLEDKF